MSVEQLSAKVEAVDEICTKMALRSHFVLRLRLIKFDVKKNEEPHGCESYLAFWPVQLDTASDLSHTVYPIPLVKKHFVVDPETVLNGDIEILAPDSGIFSLSNHYLRDAVRGFGEPKKDSPNQLSIRDNFGGQWLVSFKFSPKGMLQEIQLVHNPDEHPVLRRLLLEMAKAEKWRLLTNNNTAKVD